MIDDSERCTVSVHIREVANKKCSFNIYVKKTSIRNNLCDINTQRTYSWLVYHFILSKYRCFFKCNSNAKYDLTHITETEEKTTDKSVKC